MVSLATVGRRFDSTFQRLDGLAFSGSILPADEGAVSALLFSDERLLLRVPVDCVVTTKDIMVDAFGRYFLLADHAVGQIYDTKLYRVHRLFLLNTQVPWTRVTSSTDTLTGLPKGTGTTSPGGGSIWVTLEMYGREPMDNTMRLKEQVRRIITGYDIQLGDLVDGMVVKRLDKVLGVWLAEIQ